MITQNLSSSFPKYCLSHNYASFSVFNSCKDFYKASCQSLLLKLGSQIVSGEEPRESNCEMMKKSTSLTLVLSIYPYTHWYNSLKLGQNSQTAESNFYVINLNLMQSSKNISSKNFHQFQFVTDCSALPAI